MCVCDTPFKSFISVRGVERILYERKIPVLGQKVFYNIRLDISLSKKQNSKLVVVKLMACDSFACPRNRLGRKKKKKKWQLEIQERDVQRLLQS